MNKEDIMSILPHREDMLLLDEVENRDGVAIGQYTVRGDEFFLRGHFPNNPIVPGVILCEMLAQSACILMKEVMVEGLLSIQAGENPRVIEEKLKSFLSPERREALGGNEGGEE